ncbi:MAG: putative transcriptional regulatory protein [Verrucomicrobia subdivision 3 bacterium]|nr:putative transcriptional regulatory protein [Limisphaerales bacterium]MCS1414025.1 putative transcriptional regulatory protein [Limisphaerales bacterium]
MPDAYDPLPMGAQWKQKWREINAHKVKGQLVNKLVKKIQAATKLGGPDSDLNARLAAAMEVARKNSRPKDTIKRAVKKGDSLTGENLAR